MKSKSIKIGYLAIAFLLAWIALPPVGRAQSGSNCAPAPPGLVSWWPGEGNANDVAGTNQGTLMNGAVTAPALVGQGFSFNGQGSFVQIPDSPSLEFTNELTLELWYKDTGCALGGFYGLIAKRAGYPAGCNYGINLNLQSSPPGLQVYLQDPNYSSFQISACAVPAAGAFHHLAATYRQATSEQVELKTYIDGRLIQTATVSGNLARTVNNTPLILGADTAGADYFVGIIDEPSIYSRALTDSEVLAIYNAGSAGKCPAVHCTPAPPNIVSWWPGEGNAADIIGGNAGTLVAGTTFASGLVGEGFEFDGNGSYVRIPDSTSSRLTNAFTVELWYKDTGCPAGNYCYGLLAKRGPFPSGCNYGIHFCLGVYNSFQVYFQDPNYPGWQISYSPVPPPGLFHHVAATYRQSAAEQVQIKTYMDGQLVKTDTLPGNLQRTLNDAPVTIGSYYISEGFFVGIIDEPTIYSRELSAAEIQAIYNAGSAGKCSNSSSCVASPSGLVSWWQGEGNTLDAVGSNNGTAGGALAYASGEVRQAFSFDGTSSFIRVPASASLDVGGGQGLTMECWVMPTSTTPIPIFDSSSYGVYGVHLWVNQAGAGILYANVADIQANNHLMYSPPGVVPTNVLSHVAVTYDKASGTARLFVNGTVALESMLGTFTPQTSHDLYIGYREPMAPFGVSYFQGLIDEPSIYNRALGTNEIWAIFNAGSAGKCPPAPTPPVITTQPQSQTVVVGSPVGFNVGVSGTAPFTYQWRKDGAPISGATDSTYSIASAQLPDQAAYSVAVSNSAGGVISSNAVLTVSPQPPCVPPPSGLVSWWPGEKDATDVVGGNSGTVVGGVTNVSAVVGKGFSFDGVGSYVQIADSPTLEFTNELTLEMWYKDTGCPPGGVYGLIAKRAPYPAGCNYGINLNLYSSPPGLQVYIQDPRYPSYQISACAVPAAGAFHYLAATYRQVTSEQVELKTFVDGQLVQSNAVPGNLARTVNQTPVVLGADVPGQDLLVGIIDEPTIYDRALSASEILAIYNAGSAGKCLTPTAPSILTQPQNQTVNVGSSASFSVMATGTPPLTYQWRKDTVDIQGATTPTYMISAVQMSDVGAYSVMVSNSVGFVISSNALLTVNPAPPCVTPPPGLVSWWQGEGNTLDSFGANNTVPGGTLSYAPGKVGRAFSFDGTSGFIEVPASTSLNVGLGAGLTYEAWVQPGSTASMPVFDSSTYGVWGAHVWVNQTGVGILYANVVDTQGNSHMMYSPPGLVVGTNFTHVALTYDKTTGVARLYVNGLIVLESNFGAFTPQTAYDLCIGYHRPDAPFGVFYYRGLIDEPSVYNRALSANEIQAIYNAGSAGKCLTPTVPSILTQPQNQTVNVGSSASFSVMAAGTPPLTYQWRKDTVDIQGATTSAYTIGAAQMSDAGAYSVMVSNSVGFVISSNALLTVNPAPPCVTPPPGLVSWWQAEGNTLDSLGGNNAVAGGTLSYAPGEVGQAFNFDGTSGFVQVPTSASLNVGAGAGLTLEAWVKPESTSSMPIFDWSTYGVWGVLLWVNQTGAGILYAAVPDSSGLHIFQTSPGMVAIDNFSHVALTYDQTSGVARLYINGAVAATASFGTLTPETTHSLSIGYHPPEAPFGVFHYQGLIDEPSVYNRALSATEIQAIYNAGSAGKCVTQVAPFIVSQPRDETVTRGSTATFTVVAAGSPPLTYQWSHGGSPIDGATDSTLVLTNVAVGQSGVYAVLVTNNAGSVMSSNANLTVNFPPALLRASDRAAAAGGAVVIPVTLLANGNENALGFSLNFDPTLLTYSGLSVGSGDVGAALLINDSQAASGKVGAAIGLGAGTTFSPGTQEVALVTFNVGIVTNATSTTVSFGSVPIAQQLTDVSGGPLAVNFANGTVAIAAANLEGDVWPRPDGDKVVNLSDWVTVGRYVARLDYPTNASEFQRADCAPRATLGDGYITVIDWVQAGRYAAGLDPLTVAGGPTSEGPIVVASVAKGVSRQVSASTAMLFPNQTGTVSITLNAQGNENALGFSLQFDPTVASYQGASVGTEISGAAFNVNSLNAASGRLGFALALPSGSSFPTGVVEVVKVNFRAANASGTSAVSLTDTPVTRQVSSPAALPLPTSYVNGSITVNAPPSLSITRADQAVILSWPLWATNFVLESFGAPLTPSAVWTNVPASVTSTRTNHTVTLPLDAGPKFYRLRN